MKPRTASRLAWSLWIVGLAFASSAIVFAVLGRSTPPSADSFGPRGFGVLFTLAFGTVGAVVASRRPANGALVFRVTDDGVGFDQAMQSYGTGIQGMADRLDSIGGRLSVELAPGRGTVIEGIVPIPATDTIK